MEAISKPALGVSPLLRDQRLKPRRPALGRGRRGRALERLAVKLEARAPGTYGHSHRVSVYAAEMASAIGLAREQVARVRRGAVIHDIGKHDLPGEVLNKPGPLTAAESALVRGHAEAGAAIAAELGDEDLTAIVRHHHERWDGRGYPDGLRAGRIPLGARIVAVADTFDALTTARPYRAPIGYPQALEVLRELAGEQLDPDLAGLFCRRYAAVWAA